MEPLYPPAPPMAAVGVPRSRFLAPQMATVFGKKSDQGQNEEEEVTNDDQQDQPDWLDLVQPIQVYNDYTAV